MSVAAPTNRPFMSASRSGASRCLESINQARHRLWTICFSVAVRGPECSMLGSIPKIGSFVVWNKKGVQAFRCFPQRYESGETLSGCTECDR